MTMPGRHSGFTLIELLIAMAISAILAVGTYYLVQVSRQTQDTLVVQNEYYSQLTRVVRTLVTDLHQWVPDRPVRDPFGDYQEAMLLDQDALYLTRNGWALSRFVDMERSRLQRVSYQLAEQGSELCPEEQNRQQAESGDRHFCLIRSQRQHLDDDGRLEWQHRLLMRPVQSLQWQFLAEIEGQQNWLNTWPPEDLLNEDTVPRLLAVQFELQTGQDDAVRRMIRVPQSYQASEVADES
ncbi:type II secretion system protein GspJ [Saccharospirillum sp.]|uniref:type II secretion system protein GspJ n=1 Tax=Saccharospirillum sp. TaxID=2033801 RepID=UPI0034A02152